MTCILCGSEKLVTISVPEKKSTTNYFRCELCYIIFLNPVERLSAVEEKKRYEKHENNVTDLGYQAFVKPLVQALVENVDKKDQGLDYGSGKDSAISHLLHEKDFKVDKYDPYFNPGPEKLKLNFYDYIILCEVIEHFYHPATELEKIKSLLKSSGKLFIMTSLWTEDLNFETWSYRRDATHVCFFSAKSISWIATHLNFKNFVIINKHVIILS